MKNFPYKAVATLTLVLVGLLIFVSLYGLLNSEFYSRETPNWHAQVIGQDIADLFLIAPLLLAAAILVFNQKNIGLLLLTGGLFYTIYTFVIYSFALHFNSLFIVYCLILGLSFYLFIYLLLSPVKQDVQYWFDERLPRRLAAYYLIVVAVIFYFLWLAELLPASISNTAPAILSEIGLLTNPVHALDVSVCLPALIITGILLLKGHPLGLFLSPAMLTFCLLMDITIGGLVVVMSVRGVGTESFAVLYVMGALAAISLAILVMYFRSMKKREFYTREYVLHH